MKTLFKTIGLFIILISLFNCSSDDSINVPITPELETIVLCDASNDVALGETLILENLNSGVDYIIDCLFIVRGSLIIEPGVTIQFNTDAGIRVDDTGLIQAIGTAENQIKFTGENAIPGEWRGIFIDSNEILNELNYVTIEYAGGESFNSNNDKGAIIVWSNTRLKLRNSTIRFCESYGFNATYGGDDLELSNNTITSCLAPMFLRPQYPTTITGGTYTGNTTDAFIVDNYTYVVNNNSHWRNHGIPYRIANKLRVVAGGGNLTIDPGVTLEFELDGALEIDKGASGTVPSLIAVGTAQDPILFTGVNKVNGAWKGIYFDSPSPLNEIGFATIEYASNPAQDSAIRAWYGTVLNVHDVSFKHIDYCVIHEFTSTTFPSAISTSNLSYEDVTDIYCIN